jgi:eukaryotic translation initiation factor 2-alpha kinase 4
LDHARAAQQASQLTAQIQADTQRQQVAKQQHMKTRQRPVSGATEIHHGDILIETFAQEIDFDGLKFNAVKIFHPSQGMDRLYLLVIILI